MTAHKVVASDEVDGIALSCIHPTCDFAERGFGHTETARPVARLHEAEAACRKALEAIAPCVVGWQDGTMPVWAEKLNEAVPDLQQVLGIARAGVDHA